MITTSTTASEWDMSAGRPGGGEVSFSSFQKVLEAMIASGSIKLRPGERVAHINVTPDGLEFFYES